MDCLYTDISYIYITERMDLLQMNIKIDKIARQEQNREMPNERRKKNSTTTRNVSYKHERGKQYRHQTEK